MERTTDELMSAMHKGMMKQSLKKDLNEVLVMSDFVKFAKYIPSADDDRTSLEEIKKSIVTIEKTETKIVSDEKSK